MSSVVVTVEAEVKPTEDAEKVGEAIRNLFPTVSVKCVPEKSSSLLVCRAEGREGLARFYIRLREERILAAARRVMRQGTNSGVIRFCLNKQAAYMKRISFCEPVGESPLGPIQVRIECEDARSLIDWIVPPIGARVKT